LKQTAVSGCFFILYRKHLDYCQNDFSLDQKFPVSSDSSL
jgi:hypothetical protein